MISLISIRIGHTDPKPRSVLYALPLIFTLPAHVAAVLINFCEGVERGGTLLLNLNLIPVKIAKFNPQAASNTTATYKAGNNDAMLTLTMVAEMRVKSECL